MAVQAFCSTFGIALSLGGRRGQRDVAGHEPATECVVEGAADDQVHLVDGLGRERPGPVGGAQHRFVEPFEVLGAQPPEPLPPEGRQDVALGLVDVAAMGAGAQFDALGGQPPVGEVGTKVSARTSSLRPSRSAASRATSASASARSVPAGCQVRRSLPVTGSSPS